MKIRVDREKLHKALGRVGNLANNRAVLPLLSNVLLESSDGKLKLTTTDLELRISTEIDAVVEEAGKTTAPARKLASIISSMSGAEVEIESDDKDHVKLRCGTGKFTLFGLAAADFPEMVTGDILHKISIKENALKKMIGYVNYAVSAEDSRKVLTGVLMDVKENNLVLVATDGKRMPTQNGTPENIEGGDFSVIVPLRAINEVRRVAEGEKVMQILIGEKQLSFQSEEFELSTKLIEGNYPDYHKIIPPAFKHEIEIPTDLFKSRLQMVSILLPDASRCVVLGFKENRLDISASSSEVGEGSDSIEINYAGEEFNISFNPQFLLDPLAVMESETIRLKVNDPLVQVMMEGDEGFSCVIMPIRKM